MKYTTLKNPRTGEIWICENLENRRRIDGQDFVEVHKPNSPRTVWIILENLVKIKNTDFAKSS